MGFDSEEASVADAINSTKDTATSGESSNGKENLNTENTTTKTTVIFHSILFCQLLSYYQFVHELYLNLLQTPKVNFVQWYNENKAELEKQHPDLSSNELMKFAMDAFRTKRPIITTDVSASAKRKIVNDDGKEPSGIAKLARFNFDKR